MNTPSWGSGPRQESIDKRFCFDIIPEERHHTVYTFQAQSEEDRWARIYTFSTGLRIRIRAFLVGSGQFSPDPDSIGTGTLAM